jgi:hypothetical protein
MLALQKRPGVRLAIASKMLALHKLKKFYPNFITNFQLFNNSEQDARTPGISWSASILLAITSCSLSPLARYHLLLPIIL